jgi:ParB-like chromosome segregation protein Spo0J
LFSYALDMVFQQTPFEEIDVSDETYRISERIDWVPLLDSLRDIGQLNPVLLLERKKAKVIVCGFRRVRAMKRLGAPAVLSRILLEENGAPLRVFELALRDNISHRQLSPLEKARVLFKLKSIFGVPINVLIKRYLPLLDLMPNEHVLHAYLSLNGVQPALRQCLIEDRLTQSSVEFLSGMPPQVQDNVASLMSRIRLSASLQRKVLALLDEMSVVGGTRLDVPLAEPEVSAFLEDPRLSPFQKGEKLHEILFCKRNPQLWKALGQFNDRRRRLALPDSIRISPHPFFETPDLRVEFLASNPEHFRALANALQNAAQSPALEELYDVV